MTVKAILAEALACGVDLYIEEGKLKFRALPNAFTPALKQQVQQHKALIIEALTAEQQQAANRAEQAHLADDNVPIEVHDRTLPTPLLASFAQQRLWFLDEYMGPNGVYNIPLRWSIVGTVDGTVDEQAMLAALNEIVARHEVLRTRFCKRDGVVVQVVYPELPTVRCLTLPNQQQLQQLCQSERDTLFNLSNDPLCRIKLVKTQDNGRYALLLTLHHAVSDGVSMQLFGRELMALYEAFSHGKPSPLAELPIQYVDFALWQRKYLSGERLERQLDYWAQQLANLPMLSTFPSDRPRPQKQSFSGHTLSFCYPSGLLQALQRLSQQQGTTLFMTLLASFSILLGRYNGQQDVALGTPIANRKSPQTQPLIGFFVNTLVMRSKLSEQQRFIDLLQSTRDMALAAYEHQDVQFEQLVEALNPARNTCFSPLFQVMFAVQNDSADDFSQQGLKLAPLDFDQQHGTSGYSRFDLTLDLKQTANGLEGLIEYSSDLYDKTTILALVANFQQLLEAIVVDPAQPVYRLNYLDHSQQQQQLIDWNAPSVPVDFGSVAQQFAQLVAAQPQALVWQQGEQPLTRGDLDWQVSQVAEQLIQQGVRSGDAVALCAELPYVKVLGALAILHCGAQIVPIATHCHAMAVANIIEHSGASWLLGDNCTSHLSPSYFATVGLAKVAVLNIESFIAQPSPRASAGKYEVVGSQVAALIYGYDSEGASLGLSLSQHNFSHLVVGFSADDWQRGAVLSGLPPLADHGLLAALAQLLQSKTISAAYQQNDANLSLGHPLPNRKVYVLDHNNTLVAAGVTGTLHIGGPAVALGYHNDLAKTKRDFIADTFSEHTGARLYKTPYQVKFSRCTAAEAAQLTLVPTTSTHFDFVPSDQQQQNLSEQLRSCAEVAEVHLQYVSELGLGHICYLSAIDKTIAEPQLQSQLLAHLRCQETLLPLPEHWLIMDALPVTSGGRIDRKALPLPQSKLDASEPYVAPRNETESALVELFEQMLQRSPIGINDNYFTLGGDSIRAITLVAQAKERGLDVQIKALFAHPTIASLAEALGSEDQVVLANVAAPKPEPFALLEQSQRAQLQREFAVGQLQDAMPLSMMQQGMVVASLKQAGGNVYENMHCYLFQYPWQADLFEQSLQAVVQQHPMMRAAYRLGTEKPLQLLFNQWQVDLTVTDAAALGLSREQVIEQWLQQQKEQGIDFERQLWRASVYLLDQQQFLFCLCVHHAHWDGLSLEGVVAQIYQGYVKLTAGGQLKPPLDLPAYNQFLALEQQAVAAPQQQDYWRHAGLDEGHLPWWTGRTQTGSAIVECPIDNTLSDKLVALAQKLGVQQKSVLCSVYLQLLSLLDGHDQIIAPVLTNGRPEVENGNKMVGLFLNALPMMVSARAKTWADFIRATDTLMREQHAYRHFPLPEIQRITGQDYSASLFNYVNLYAFYQDQPSDNQLSDSHDMVGSPEKVGGWADTNYGLLMDASKNEQSGRFHITISADAEIFDLDLRARMQGYVARIIDGIANRADATIDRAALLGQGEKQRLLSDWGRVDHKYNDNLCLHQLFEQQVKLKPAAIALIQSGQQLSYRELNCRANRLAHQLIVQGVQVEMPVGLCMARSIDWVIAMLAVLKAGGAYVAIDPNNPQQRIDYLLNHAQLSLVLCQQAEVPLLRGHHCQRVVLDDSDTVTAIAQQPEHDIGAQSIGLTAQHLSCIIYTSGSTGLPKGVMCRHHSFANRVQWHNRVMAIGENDVLVQKTSVGFVDHLAEVFQALSAGVALVILATEVIQTPRQMMAEFERYQITQLTLVPSLLNALMATEQFSLPSLTRIYCSGEALQLPQLRRFKQCFANATLYNFYGSTEIGADVTAGALIDADFGDEQERRFAAIGTLIDNNQAYVLSVEGQLVPQGVVGQLYVGGSGLARGYLHSPALTAQSFVPNPFANTPGERLYGTGDLVRFLDDGRFDYVGRIDHQLKIRGFRIEPGEIESVLKQHPQVKDSVVTAVSSQNNEKLLVAYSVYCQPVNRGDSAEMTTELRQWVSERLPEYMVPRFFLALDQMPMTNSGKLDRKALPKPDLSQTSASAARSMSEQVLLGLWQGILHCGDVGSEQSFFDLGGHSLQITQLLSRIYHAFGVELTIAELFQHHTIAAQATLIGQRSGQQQAPFQAIEAMPVGLPIPLSNSQQRLWFINELMGPSCVYNMPLVLRIAGLDNSQVLLDALAEIGERHQILKTRFVDDGQSVYQLITSDPLLPTIETMDNSEDIRQLCQAERDYPFDLAKDPLCRFKIIDDRSGEIPSYLLLATMHHSASDAWSMGLFVQELAALCRAYADGQPSPLPAVEIQYADFAYWQQQQISQSLLQNQLDYWRTQLADLPGLLALPTDKVRPTQQTFNGSFAPLHIDKSVVDALEPLFKAHGVTLYMSLISAFAVLLGRYSGQKDIVLGTPIANRTRQQTEALMGFFVNSLVIRTDLSEDPCYLELLKQTRKVMLEAYSHQDISFERLVDELSPQRSLSYSPLFQVSFSLIDTPMALTSAGDIDIRAEDVAYQDHGISRYDITFNLTATENGLVGGMEYNTDLFYRTTIDNMLNQYVQLLSALVAAPNTPVSQLQCLDEASRALQLQHWNNTAKVLPEPQCVHQLFERQVAASPTKVALVFDGEQMSYQTLNNRANQLARYLVSQGVGPDVAVAVCIERSFDMVLAILAILKAGGCYVPLDPEYPAARLEFMLQQANCAMVLSDSYLLEEIEVLSHVKSLPLDSEICEMLLRRFAQDNLEDVRVNSQNLAYIIFTSGTTGEPKGNAIMHQNIVRLAFAEFIDRSAGATILAAASPSFDAFTFELWGALLHGGRSVIVDLKQTTFAQLGRLLADEQVDCAWLTSALFNQIVNDDCNTLQGLKYLLVGGEALSKAHVEKALRALPQLQIVNGYGPTESTTFACTYKVDLSAIASLGSVPIGQPIGNTRAYVLSEQMLLLPVGAVGELYIGGLGLGRGYLNRPGATAASFIPNPFSQIEGERLYRTGDLVRYLDDGRIEYIGRVDNQVKLRGFRIELGEITAAILRHPAVCDATVVLTCQDSAEKHLVAYFVLQQGEDEQSAPASEEQLVQALRAMLQKSLPAYMLPSALVQLDAMPLTANGKLDYRALPEADLSHQQAQYVAPQTPQQKTLCEIWQTVLQVEQVGIEDNFFAIGGDSILCIRIIGQAKDRGLNLSVKDMFEYQTIKQLSDTVDLLAGEQEIALAPFALLSEAEIAALGDDCQARYDDAYPLSELQQGMVFHTQLESAGETYHDIFSYHIKAPLQLPLFEQALTVMFQRYPVLRSGYHLAGERPIQTVYKNFQLPLRYQDISHLSSTQQQAHLDHWLEQEKQLGFDWQGPLYRVFLHRRDDQHFELGVSFHHAVYDGWSNATFIKQLLTSYQSLLEGRPLAQAPVDFAFRDFVALEAQIIKDDKAKLFWQNMHQGSVAEQIPRQAMVQDKLRSRQTASLEVEGFNQRAAALIQLGQSQKVPLQAIFLAVHCKVLATLSGQSTALTSYVVNGRPETQAGEQGLGLFLNSLPINFSVADTSWQQLIFDISAQLNRCMAYRRYPSSLIARDNDREFAEVLFNYTHFHAFEALRQNSAIELIDSKGFEQTNYDFSANFSRAVDDDRMVLMFTYDIALYDVQLMTRIGHYYLQAFDHMLEALQGRHSQLSLLPQDEYQRLVYDYNDTTTSYPQSLCIQTLFERQVEQASTAEALCYQSQRLDYGSLNRQANRLAHYLLDQGVAADVPVGICAERSFAMVVSMLAILKAGGCYVPIDPQYPQTRLDYIIADSGVKLILTQTHLKQSLSGHSAANVPWLDVEQQEVFAGHSDANPPLTLSCDNLAYIIYTSGSTGNPKGAALSHRALVNRIDWMQRQYNLTVHDRVLQKTPYSFDVSVWEFFWPLTTGAVLVIAEPEGHKDPAYLAALIESAQVSVLHFVPSMLNAFLGATRWQQCQSVRQVVCSGEALPKQLVDEFHQLAGDSQLDNLYGPTEAAIDVSYYRCDKQSPLASVPIGKPIHNICLYVVDSYLNPVPQGCVGELMIAGVGLARGYVKRAGLTAETFMPNPFAKTAGERLYRTGDLARILADGNIEYVGRVDHQVKLNGFRIELGEIEHALCQHPEVTQALVIAKDQRLVGYVATSLADPHSPIAQTTLVNQLLSDLKAQLPSHMVPTMLAVLPSFKLTANGKLDRSVLPDINMPAQQLTPYVEPQTALEIQLAQLWKSNLGLERVGIDDNYFAIGGDSIRSIAIVAQAKSQDILFSVRDLFANPSISALVLVINQGLAETTQQQEIEIEEFSLLSEDDMSSLFNFDDEI